MPQWKQNANFLLPNDFLGFKSRELNCGGWTPLQFPLIWEAPITFLQPFVFFIFLNESPFTFFYFQPLFLDRHIEVLKKKIRQFEPSGTVPYSSCQECPMSAAGSSISKSMNQDFNYTLSRRKMLALLLPYTLLVGITVWHWLNLSPCGEMWDGEMQTYWWKFVHIFSCMFLYLVSSKNSWLYKKIKIDSRRFEVS